MARPSFSLDDTFVHERTFTIEDVNHFTEVSGDRGSHHVTPDAKGRLMVQGLLTATLPSKMGGDFDYIARSMTFEFDRPVYTGDTINCLGRITKMNKRDDRIEMDLAFDCKNQHGKVVMRGRTTGAVFG